MWMRAARPPVEFYPAPQRPGVLFRPAAARRSYFQIFQTFQILFDFRQPGVGLGDQPGAPGYLLQPVPLAEGFLAFPGPAPGGPAHSGGAGDFPERCT